ncbi:MAG: MFS transporter [Ectothiorhodospiraceae bacterium]|nr:MFS transporter [Ectothiorhodospiraceae bacterium]
MIGAVSDRGAVWMLAIGQTLVWAGIYYIFPALLPHWEQDLGWPKTQLAAGFTVALVASALSAPIAGRLVDRDHGPKLLAGCAAVGGALVAAMSAVTEPWQHVVLWALVGVTMAGALYEACFAHITHRLGSDARSAITLITLVAGFAGSVAFPCAHLLAEALGWRGAVQVAGAVVVLTAAPLLWLGARGVGAADGAGAAARAAAGRGAARRAMRTPVFWLLAATFAMVALNHGVLITHLLPLLAERGVPTALAVLAASLIGPMQVVGRVIMLGLQKRVPFAAVCAGSNLFMVAAAGALYAAGAIPGLVFLFVALQGSGYGVTSITRPVITADYLGRDGFGAISGAIAIGYMGAFAAGPTLGALLWSIGGYDLVLLACMGFAATALGCFLAATRLRGA